MEMTSKQAARLLGVHVTTWHRLARAHKIEPARQLDGIRGAKLWHADDVARVRTEVAS